MTDTSTDAVKALMDGVTDGPWEWVPPYDGYFVHGSGQSDLGGIEPNVCYFGDDTFYYPSEGTPAKPEDARFIATARDLVPALLSERDALRDKLDDVVALLIEASADLTAYVDADYPPESCARYPDIARRHHRDLELVRRIATTLAEIKGENHE